MQGRGGHLAQSPPDAGPAGQPDMMSGPSLLTPPFRARVLLALLHRGHAKPPHTPQGAAPQTRSAELPALRPCALLPAAGTGTWSGAGGTEWPGQDAKPPSRLPQAASVPRTSCPVPGQRKDTPGPRDLGEATAGFWPHPQGHLPLHSVHPGLRVLHPGSAGDAEGNQAGPGLRVPVAVAGLGPSDL